MKSTVVASPPAKPLMIFDGDCNFCGFWIRRWNHATGDAIDYLPFQDPTVLARFPEIPRGDFESAVQLIETDGAVYRGAEAAFRALAHNPRKKWLLAWYQHSPGFSKTCEWGYQLVAGHRGFFSALTRLAWGRDPEPATHFFTTWLFLRSLGLIYLVAFLSLWVQIIGLVGANGILPANLTMETNRQAMIAAKVSLERYHQAPTLCWFNTSDRFLKFQCAAGTFLAVFLVAGFASAPCLFLLWLIYLSLATVCREFLGFQWDNLLLEAGFLAIFLPRWQLLPSLLRAGPPSRMVLWLLRWLLFRLMFESGCVKLLSHDPAWHDLTALTYHYETQPLPTWLGWYAHQLPLGVQKICAALMFGIELGVPFLIFAPRRLRQTSCVALVAFQVIIFLTGNYCFFNLLTIALCLLLLDDAAVRKLVPKQWRAFPLPDSPPGQQQVQPSLHKRSNWRLLLTIPLACTVLATSLVQFALLFQSDSDRAEGRQAAPRALLAFSQWLSPFRTFSGYGLFAVMTTSRPEIIIEGSNDGAAWLAYEFKYKPGDTKRRPKFVAPHQPRLDWQMWFAALSNYRHNPWLVHFCVCLLQGSPEVLSLLERNPFPDAPPRYLRAMVYEYHFTDFATGGKTGAWWWRELKGEYLPVLSLRETR